jgi:hypothetical protein
MEIIMLKNALSTNNGKEYTMNVTEDTITLNIKFIIFLKY